MITLRSASIVAGLGLALALSGCSSSDSDTDTAEANAAWCEGAAKVETEITELVALIENGSSADLVKQQWNSVESAIQANSVPLSQLSDSVQEDAAAAYEALEASVDAIPDDLPPSEAAPQYQAAFETFATEIQSAKDEVGCS
jgi:soluble cytochrome b562